MADGLPSSISYIRDGAINYFGSLYENPKMFLAQELDPKLRWVPTFYFTINEHLTVACEVSESVYPAILEMRRKDVEDIPNPISVYCACPEEAYLARQEDAKRLISHGIGLITVDRDGVAQIRAACIPLVQQVSQLTFKAEIGAAPSLPSPLRRRLAEAFDRYRQSAPSGVADVSEVLEGMVLRAGQDATRKGWITSGDARPGNPAKTIDAMLACGKCNSAAAALGGMRSYISQYRTAAHHFPKNKRQAHIKYVDCKHAFIEGLKKARQFREAMRHLSLSGSMAKV